MNERIALSVVVITKNEESNIEDCLRSVANWADEIIIVDDESTDKTRQMARNFTAKIFIRRMDIEGKHRNWAYAQAKNEWVLSLDADEMVSEELKEEISAALKNTDCSGFSIPLRNYLGNYWVRFSGWYPASKLRLFKKDKFRYEEVEVHPRAFLEGKEGHLTKDIIHKGYPDLEHFLASLNRQTTLEAKKWINNNRKMSLGRIIWRTLDRFIRSFFVKKGFRDGFIGFMIAYFASLYQVMSYAKYIEMKKEDFK